jgi:hypothetical protein
MLSSSLAAPRCAVPAIEKTSPTFTSHKPFFTAHIVGCFASANTRAAKKLHLIPMQKVPHNDLLPEVWKIRTTCFPSSHPFGTQEA